MPVGRIQRIDSFKGLVRSFVARSLARNVATAIGQMDVDRGTLAGRAGYRIMKAAPGGVTDILGIAYLLSTSGASEIVYIQDSSGTRRPYSLSTGSDPSGVTRTEILDGASHASCEAGPWQGVAFVANGTANSYWCNPSHGALVRHAIGDATSWTTLSQPTGPSTLTRGTTAFPAVSATGYHSATLTVGGNATTPTETGSGAGIQVLHSSTNGAGQITIDLNGSTMGIQDWQDLDNVKVPFTWNYPSLQIDKDSFRVTLINNDGTPLSKPQTAWARNPAGEPNGQATVEFYWDDKITADFDNVRKIQIDYNTTSNSGTVANNWLRIGLPKLRYADLAKDYPTTQTTIEFAASYYSSTTLLESTLHPVLVPVGCFSSYRMGARYDDAAVTAGATTLVCPPSLDATIDFVNFYGRGADGLYYRLAQVAHSGVGNVTTTVKASLAEMLLGEHQVEYTLPGSGINCLGTMYNSWLVVGMQGGGKRAIRHGWIGQEKFAAATPAQSTLLDDDRGKDFAMPADDPLAIYHADACVIVGRDACYGQRGESPAEMAPVRMVPGSRGAAGRYASCLWRDDAGNPGVVVVDRDGNVWFTIVNQAFDGKGGYTWVEIGEEIRGRLLEIAAMYSLSDLSTLRAVWDARVDAIRLIIGRGVLSLTRPQVNGGGRQWVEHHYTTAASSQPHIKQSVYAPGIGWRCVLANGEYDEMEWNSQTGARITGANRDGGRQIESGTIQWTSPVIDGPPRRIKWLRAIRTGKTGAVTLTVTSDRQTKTYTVLDGHDIVRCDPRQQGRSHQIQVVLTETSQEIEAIEYEEVGPITERRGT